MFIVDKLHPDCHGYDNTLASVKNSLDTLKTPYIDLYLIQSFGGYI